VFLAEVPNPQFMVIGDLPAVKTWIHKFQNGGPFSQTALQHSKKSIKVASEIVEQVVA